VAQNAGIVARCRKAGAEFLPVSQVTLDRLGVSSGETEQVIPKWALVNSSRPSGGAGPGNDLLTSAAMGFGRTGRLAESGPHLRVPRRRTMGTRVYSNAVSRIHGGRLQECGLLFSAVVTVYSGFADRIDEDAERFSILGVHQAMPGAGDLFGPRQRRSSAFGPRPGSETPI
jgi:hypothetical protein